MRKLFLICLAILLGASLLLLVVPSIFEEQIANALRQEINQNLDAEVTFTDAHINLWRNFPQFTASLDNFAISGKNEFRGDTLIAAQELRLVLSTGRFLFEEGIEIKHLTIRQPDIFVSVLHNGRANYHIAKDDAADTTSNVTLDIESWEVEDGRLTYHDRDNGILVKAERISLNGGIALKDRVTGISVAGVAGKLNMTHAGRNYMQDKNISFILEGSYDSRSEELKFSENNLRINNLDLTFSGSLGFRGDDTGIDLKIKTGEAEFKDILSLSKVLSQDFDKMNVQGRMSLDAQFLGVYNNAKEKIPAFKANLIVSDGSIKYNALQSSLNQINFDLAAYNTDGHLENTIVNLQYFGMNVGENPLYGSAQIEGFKDGRIAADMLARFPLQELAAVYPMEGIEMSGNLDFELKANGTYSGKFSDLTELKDWQASRVPAFHLGVALTDGNIRYSHLPDTIKNINLNLFADNKTGAFDDTMVRIERLQGILGDNPISGHLSFQGFTEPVMSGAIKAGMNLADLKDFYPIDHLTLKGLVDIDLKVDGKWSKSDKLFPKILASVNVRDGYLKSDRYPAPMEDTHLVLQAVNDTGKFADTKFAIDTLTCSIENESFVVSGWIQDLEKYNYDLDITGVLYLEKLHRIFALEKTEMRGEADIDIKASGNLTDLREKRYHLLPAEGQIKLKDVYLRNDRIPHGLNIKEGHLYFTNEKILLDTLHGAIGKSTFNLTGHFYNYLAYVFHSHEPIKGDLQFESENFDVNELLSEEKSSRDTVHHELAATVLPVNVEFTFDSKIHHLVYKNLSLNNFIGEVALHNGVLTLNKTTFDALDASFNLSGDYDPRDTRHPKFDLDLGIHELDINKAYDAFVTVQAIAPAAEHTNGIFSIDYKLTGELTHSLFPVFGSLKGSGTVRIRDAVINGMKLFHHIGGLTKKEELMNPKLKDIIMDIEVDKGVVEVKPFTMKLGGFDTEVAGRHELTGYMNYILKIALPPFDLVKIPLHVDGTYDNPKVHIGKGHEENLKRTIVHSADAKSGEAGLN
jgi:AsmA protein